MPALRTTEATGEPAPGEPPAVNGNVTGLLASAIPIGKAFVNAPPPPPPKPPAVHLQAAAEPMRVSGGVQTAKLIRKVIPIYPPLAKRARISGVVHLIGIISKDGAIRNLQVIDGHPMLVRAAVQAVEQWVYQPTLLNGAPVEVMAPIEVSFTLSE